MPNQLIQIAPVSWEHPADRAALNTLRALPGFDELLRKVMSLLGERGVRNLFTANAVRVGPRQRPKFNALFDDVLHTMDWPERPDLFVSQSPVANAMAVGFDKPFIVVNSAAIDILDWDERRVLLGHELGHVMSGHATYTTLAMIILRIGFSNIPGLGLIALPVQLALLEWSRKAELSSDRAGLLATQDPMASMRLFLKFAGGITTDDELDLDEFLAQAQEYEERGGALDAIFRVLNVALRTHPFNTVRAAELQRWIHTGAYDRIVNGDYPHRGDNDRPLSDDYAEAAGYYRNEAQSAVETVKDALRGARDAFNNAYRNATSK